MHIFNQVVFKMCRGSREQLPRSDPWKRIMAANSSQPGNRQQEERRPPQDDLDSSHNPEVRHLYQEGAGPCISMCDSSPMTQVKCDFLVVCTCTCIRVCCRYTIRIYIYMVYTQNLRISDINSPSRRFHITSVFSLLMFHTFWSFYALLYWTAGLLLKTTHA